jgi:hypothetical protein
VRLSLADARVLFYSHKEVRYCRITPRNRRQNHPFGGYARLCQLAPFFAVRFPLVLTALVGGLLYSAGTILFGIVVWRSATLPNWAGVLYAPTGLLLSIAGLMIGAAQTLAAILIIASGAWIAWSAMRQPSTGPTEAAQPRVS